MITQEEAVRYMKALSEIGSQICKECSRAEIALLALSPPEEMEEVEETIYRVYNKGGETWQSAKTLDIAQKLMQQLQAEQIVIYRGIKRIAKKKKVLRREEIGEVIDLPNGVVHFLWDETPPKVPKRAKLYAEWEE